MHFTFFRPSGNELPIASAQASEITPSAATRPIKLIRFDKGHFVANLHLGIGKWTFLIQATPTTGAGISAYFRQTIGFQGGTTCP